MPNSLVRMFNYIKNSQNIPNFFKHMSITSIYKRKGPTNLLKSQRGIFGLSKVRCVLDKLLHNDIYDTIEQNLTCSNVGGRKGKGMRDQLFILYSIINNVINGKSKSLCLMSYDIIQAFDKMNFAETHNDLWDVKITNNKFALICQLDQECHVTVKTLWGETKPALSMREYFKVLFSEV